MLINLRRIFQFGRTSFSRNAGLNAATIFVMVITISLITSLFLFQEVSRFLISYFEEKIDISVYFKKDSLVEDHLNLQEELAKIPEVKNIEYISREEALEIFIQRHKDNPASMESLAKIGENPFPAHLNVRTFEVDQYATVASFLEKDHIQGLIERDDYYQRKPVIERIFTITSGINQVGIGFSLIFGIMAILVAFNTIRLAIYNSREEISVQRLVGASNWFIRGPFLVQGAIAGFLAAIICLFIFSLAVFFLNPRIEIWIAGLNLADYFFGNLLIVFLIQFVTGVGLGVISSAIAVRKYLKV